MFAGLYFAAAGYGGLAFVVTTFLPFYGMNANKTTGALIHPE